MPLNKVTLKQEIINGVNAIDMESDDIAGQIAEVYADAIDNYIKQGTITVSAGIPVATAGSAAAQTGATTAPGTGTIS